MPDVTAAVPRHLDPISVAARAYRIAVAGAAVALLYGCQSTSDSYELSERPANSEPVQIVVTKFASPSTTGSGDWNARMQPLFLQARALVERQTGEDLSDVTLNIASDRSITDEVSHETQRLIHSQFDNRQFANRFLDSVMRGQQGTYAALYATRKSEVMVSSSLMQGYIRSLPNDKHIQETAILALLIHELVHAADDKQYKIHENRDLNFRASFAQSAAFEGHAQWVTRNICTQANCLPGLEALDNFMFGTRNPPNKLTQTVQAISRNVLEYSYVEGERFIANLANRPNGQQLIANLLSNPPQDPIQILDPKSYPNTEREQRNQELISASTSFSHPWLRGAWTSVQTSPLKGVNLRTDPTRRNAAVDGFTRLITSMVALQLYNQAQPGLTPIELTVLKTESPETAKLFAKTLHDNTRVNGAQLSSSDELVKVRENPNAQPALLYMTKEPTESEDIYYTLVGVSGVSVVQIAGVGNSEALFVDYIDQLLLKLASTQQAPLARVNYTR